MTCRKTTIPPRDITENAHNRSPPTIHASTAFKSTLPSRRGPRPGPVRGDLAPLHEFVDDTLASSPSLSDELCGGGSETCAGRPSPPLSATEAWHECRFSCACARDCRPGRSRLLTPPTASAAASAPAAPSAAAPPVAVGAEGSSSSSARAVRLAASAQSGEA